MQVQEKTERPLKWFVLPNESYKWDFVLAKYFDKNSEQAAVTESGGIERLADDNFDKDYVNTDKRRK